MLLPMCDGFALSLVATMSEQMHINVAPERVQELIPVELEQLTFPVVPRVEHKPSCTVSE